MIPEQASLGLLIAVLGGVSLLFLCFLVLGSFFFKKNAGRGFSFFSDFPFEMVSSLEEGKWLVRLFGGGFLLFDFLSALFLINAFTFYPHGVFYLALLAAFFHMTRVGLLFFLFLLPARYNKPHVKVVALYFVFSTFSFLSEGVFLLRYAAGRIAPMVMSFLLLFSALANGLLMANPRFSEWARLASEEDGAGEVIVKRPRFFLLAYSEWIEVLFDFLAVFFLDLGFLLLYLA